MKRLAVIFAFLLVVLAAVMVGGYLAFGPDSSTPRRPVVATPADSEPDTRRDDPPIRDEGIDRQNTNPDPADDRANQPDADDQPVPDGDERVVPDTDRTAPDADDGNEQPEEKLEPVSGTVSFAGRVLNDEGAPAPGVTIALYYDSTVGRTQRQGGETPLQKLAVARTDQDGYYRGQARLTFPGAGTKLTVTLQAQRDEGLHSDKLEQEVEPDGGYQNIDFEIPSGSRLSGRVVTQSFEPIADAIVSAQWTDGQKRASPVKVRADEQGAFVVEGLKPGTYMVTATANGYQADSEAQQVEVESGIDHEMSGDLVLKPVTGLRLQLTSTAGQPTGDFTVTFYNAEGKATRTKGRADNEGKALISPAPEDAIEIEVEMSGYEKSERMAVFIIKDDHADLGIVNMTSHATDGD